MSQQDVETIKGAYEAFGRQDIPGLMEAFADDIDWYTPETLPWGGTFKGKEEVGGFFAGLAEKLEDLRAEPDEFLDAGDRVVVTGTHFGRLKGGRDFEARWVMLWTMRDGRAVSFREVVDTAAIVQSREGAAA